MQRCFILLVGFHQDSKHFVPVSLGKCGLITERDIKCRPKRCNVYSSWCNSNTPIYHKFPAILTIPYISTTPGKNLPVWKELINDIHISYMCAECEYKASLLLAIVVNACNLASQPNWIHITQTPRKQKSHKEKIFCVKKRKCIEKVQETTFSNTRNDIKGIRL